MWRVRWRAWWWWWRRSSFSPSLTATSERAITQLQIAIDQPNIFEQTVVVLFLKLELAGRSASSPKFMPMERVWFVVRQLRVIQLSLTVPSCRRCLPTVARQATHAIASIHQAILPEEQGNFDLPLVVCSCLLLQSISISISTSTSPSQIDDSMMVVLLIAGC